jgi:hypothetical protein
VSPASTSRSSSSSFSSSHARSTGETSRATIFGCAVGFQVSPSANSSSWIFSPGRAPMNEIATSTSGWLAHVEHEDAAAAADRAGLDHERDRLRDRHEEARHLRVGHGHRAAALDLAAEERDHGAGRVEHVPEADGDELRRHVVALAVRADDPLAERLRLPVDAVRVERLVGRDQHEALDPARDRDVGDDARAEDVVRDRLERVRLHQRHVLVRGRVEDDVGPVALEDLAQPPLVAHVGEHGHARAEAALVHELALDLEERALGLVDEHDPLRLGARELAAELGADRAPGTGDEDGLARDVRRDRAHVDLDRLAAEQVLHLDRPDLVGEVEIAGDQLVQARQRLHGDVLGARDVDDPRALVARRGRDRDQHLVRAAVAEDVRELVGRAEDADPVQAHVPLARVVVDEPDRRVAERGRAQHLLQHQLGRVAGTDEDHLLAPRHDRAALRALDDRPRQHPRAGDEGEREQAVDHPHRARDLRRVHVEEGEDEEGDEARRDDAARRAPHVARRDVAPPAVVEAEEREDGELDRGDEAEQLPGDVLLVVDRQELVEAEPEREPPGRDDDDEVGRELRQPVAVERAPHAPGHLGT